jgi:BirA family biotin operon repressor/biotin-[acetyl-CoA-carboxylase] ligase
MRLIRLDEVDSTNRYLRALAEEGAESGTLVMADRQTAGRGRLDRRFDSPEGGLYMSLLLRGRCKSTDLALLTAEAAVAAARAIEALAPSLSVGIKWVNDLYVGGKKLAGILAESSLLPSGELDYAIVGIGVNLRSGVLSHALSEIATSIEDESGAAPDREALAEAIGEGLLSAFGRLGEGIAEYRRRQILVGRRVYADDGKRRICVRVRGVDDAAGLIVSRYGKRRVLRYGEVSVKVRR